MKLRTAGDPLRDERVQTVSHDLRAPLGAAEGYLRFLIEEEAGPLTEEQKELLETVTENLEGLRTFVSDMLDQARLDEGRMPFDYAPTDVRGLVRETLRTFRFAAVERGVSLGGWVAAGTPLAEMDGARIRQVLQNLVGNALKFTEAGGKVLVSAWAAGGHLHAAVEDDGCGIPAAAVGALFERFRQAPGLKAPEGRARGSGLGLSIARGIVEGHGGSIECESAEGAGSTFRFHIPLERRKA